MSEADFSTDPWLTAIEGDSTGSASGSPTNVGGPLLRRNALLADRVTRQLVTSDSALGATEEVVIHTDVVGAAKLMGELVACGLLGATLRERNGRWQVVVPGAALSQIVELVAEGLDNGRLAFATISVGSRTYTMQPLPAVLRGSHVTAAAAA